MQSAKDLILARLHLMAILPLLEDIIEFDKNVQQLVKGWNGAFQFRLPQAKAAVTLVFTNGLLTVKKENQPRQCAALTFKNARFLNDVFQGKTQKSPRPNLLSLLQLKKILQLDQVLQKLEFYLKPEDDLLNNPDTFEFCVKLALYALAFGLKEIGENDPDLITLSHHIPDGTLEIRVSEDPVVHVAVRGGKFYPTRGRAEYANTILELRDWNTAWALVQGNLDNFAAVGSGDIKLRGYLPLMEEISPLMDRLALYLGT
jgi:hypothetical protein